MASQYSPESEEYHSLSGNEPEDHEDDAESEAMESPVHPVAAMQEAFEESIIESTTEEEIPRILPERDAEVRRQKLLNSKRYDDSLNSRWNQRMTAQHHPLMKLLAQIIFGMHLLQQEQAKSEEEVVRILQTHVNEVDSFLERTAEDFELAIKDIEERIKFLKLPMRHQDVFNIMLDEKKFRTQLLDGNEKIEKIIERTTGAMNAALLDIQTGIEANKQLSLYLDSVHDRWPREKRAISDVFGAMRGNEQGWTGYLKDLQVKGKTLGNNMDGLAELIAQMSKLAAAASRRNKAQGDRAYASVSGSRSAPNSPGLRSKFAPDPAPPPMPGSPPSRSASLNKPLPREPQVVAGSPQVGKASGVHPVPLSKRFESPRQTPQSPDRRRVPSNGNGEIMRPKTADGPIRRKEARAADERANTADLLDFFKQGHSNPLRSNPPSSQRSLSASPPERKPVRSQSQGANLMLDTRAATEKQHTGTGRSLSQGAVEMRQSKSTPIVLPAISENDRPPTYEPNSAQSPPRRSAFARRLSKRIRHMQTEEPSQPQQAQAQAKQIPIDRPAYPSPSSAATTSPLIDSAYASSIEKPKQSYEPIRTVGGDVKQPIKGFTLFPQPPPLPATATHPQKNDSTEDHKSVATSMSKGRSFGSMRKYFHLRRGSRV